MSDRSRWTARHAAAAGRPSGAPSEWVLARALALPRDALILDLAAGRGRHAAPLARAGRCVVALDVVESAVIAARELARGAAGTVLGLAADARALPIRAGAIDAVLCVNYLDRSLLHRMGALLRPGGQLIVETFTTAQRALGRGPTDPLHLLAPGELPALVAPLAVVEHDERLVRDAAGERYVARIVAVNA